MFIAKPTQSFVGPAQRRTRGDWNDGDGPFEGRPAWDKLAHPAISREAVPAPLTIGATRAPSSPRGASPEIAVKKTKQDPRKTRVLIVDDHPMTRSGLASLVNHQPDMATCCEAQDAAQALAGIMRT